MDKLKALRGKLEENGIDLFLATRPVSRRYLTGFTGSAGIVWIDNSTKRLITDFRYIEQATNQCPDWQIVKHEQNALEEIFGLIKAENVNRIGFEAEHLTVSQLKQWEKAFPGIELVPTTNWVADLQIIKGEQEIDALKRAAAIADQAFAELMPRVKVGAMEQELALELEFLMRKKGASGVSFDPIIASGPNSALPHARPSERRLQPGDFVVMDFGCVVDGYCSDMTRTLVIGEPTNKHREIYDIVLQAQLAGLEAVQVGKSGKEVDAVARKVIEDAGYGQQFGHGLGHGVGLEVHEAPRLSKLGDIVLQPKMVVTVEPGIYLPGWGGVRIEDLVVVDDQQNQILSTTSKEMIIID